ncbi:MAG: hypothetical protein LBO02_01830, partial [Holosporaceae bacterium]|nr:hypothetical protein [Holosporaceae bacterium]
MKKALILASFYVALCGEVYPMISIDSINCANYWQAREQRLNRLVNLPNAQLYINSLNSIVNVSGGPAANIQARALQEMLGNVDAFINSFTHQPPASVSIPRAVDPSEFEMPSDEGEPFGFDEQEEEPLAVKVKSTEENFQEHILGIKEDLEAVGGELNPMISLNEWKETRRITRWLDRMTTLGKVFRNQSIPTTVEDISRFKSGNIDMYGGRDTQVREVFSPEDLHRLINFNMFFMNKIVDKAWLDIVGFQNFILDFCFGKYIDVMGFKQFVNNSPLSFFPSEVREQVLTLIRQEIIITSPHTVLGEGWYKWNVYRIDNTPVDETIRRKVRIA